MSRKLVNEKNTDISVVCSVPRNIHDVIFHETISRLIRQKTVSLNALRTDIEIPINDGSAMVRAEKGLWL